MFSGGVCHIRKFSQMGCARSDSVHRWAELDQRAFSGRSRSEGVVRCAELEFVKSTATIRQWSSVITEALLRIFSPCRDSSKKS